MSGLLVSRHYKTERSVARALLFLCRYPRNSLGRSGDIHSFLSMHNALFYEHFLALAVYDLDVEAILGIDYANALEVEVDCFPLG